MTALALTDRDGAYGAVKFAKACLGAGIAPILGADLAVGALPAEGVDQNSSAAATATTRRTPARGGAGVDPRHRRITVLARGAVGWAALCRVISDAHLRGRRGQPVTDPSMLAGRAADGQLSVLLGPSSDVGAALARRRPDLAQAAVQRWRGLFPDGQLLLEVVCHFGSADAADPLACSLPQAARMLGFADSVGLPAVLTNAVRYAQPGDAITVDVLDAVRRLVPMDARHLDRPNAQGWLKPVAAMHRIAAELAGQVSVAGDTDRQVAHRLLATTAELAGSCRLDPVSDLGIGGVALPELAAIPSIAGDPRVQSTATAVGAAAWGSAAIREEARIGDAILRERCLVGLNSRPASGSGAEVRSRLDDELATIAELGYATYFLTVADVVDLIRDRGVRVAARGSGAGSLVNYALGVSGVDPMAHGLLMERFLSPLRQALPDIDVDVESARREEIYTAILDRYGGSRCACVSMMDTYRVRHAVRDVGAALGLPPGEIDTIAKAFPHIRARDARAAMRDLPELRAGLGRDGGAERLELLLSLVERLDGLPRHVAVHPCGVLLSNSRLLDRTPLEASWTGFPMSQFDKDDVEDLGLLKLDVLGIRMQSAMAHAVTEIARVDGEAVDLDSVPLDDPDTFALIQSTHTLGCFQIESPGQRELIGKFAPETFGDLITDISLFRPGPVKSDMVTPFLKARQGWDQPEYLHPDLRPALAETCGVVVFHEQVLRVIATMTGCSLAQADEARRHLGSPDTAPAVREWFHPTAIRNGFDLVTVEKVWQVLAAFASFGFCKAHAAAFALPTYQSAWLKAHHPAAFLAGVLTHDPGMYPKRLILDDARQMGIAILGLDVNESEATYRVERLNPTDEPPPEILGAPPRRLATPGVPDGRAYGIRLALPELKGINDEEVHRILANRPYATLTDFFHRARVSRPILERLVLAGAFDSLYGLNSPAPVRRRGKVTRRDLLLAAADLDRWARPAPGARARRSRARRIDSAAAEADPALLAAEQTQAPSPVRVPDVQLALDIGPTEPEPGSGLPEMTAAERVRAELDVLGLDASGHVVDFYAPVLNAIGVTRSADLLGQRSQAELWVAGVKVATQTPPIRSGRRVVFLTLDDGTGPVDATFFEDAQGPYAATLFHSWLLLVRGHLRRTGPRGVSLRATGCWELTSVSAAYRDGGIEAVHDLLVPPPGWGQVDDAAVAAAAASRSTRPVLVRAPDGASFDPAAGPAGTRAGGMGPRRVLVHVSGFKQSPYADVRPPGEEVTKPPRKLWHSSPGSSGG
jgi:error-prone DNA polymerase